MYSLRFLGGASFEGPSGPVSSRAAQKRELALLAILAAAPRGVTRDKLVGCLWPDSDDDTARRLLSNALYILRREMGEESVQTAGDTVLLNPEIVRSDVGAFQEAIAAGNLEEAAAADHQQGQSVGNDDSYCVGASFIEDLRRKVFR